MGDGRDDRLYRECLVVLAGDIAAAEAEEAEIMPRLAAVGDRLASMRRARAEVARLLGDPDSGPGPGCRRRDMPTHGDAAEAVLRAAMRPMTLAEIVAGLVATGRDLPPDPRNRVSAICSAMSRRPHVFAKESYGVYALKEWGGPGETVPVCRGGQR